MWQAAKKVAVGFGIQSAKDYEAQVRETRISWVRTQTTVIHNSG